MDVLTKHLSQVHDGLTLLNHDEFEGVLNALILVKKLNGTVYTFGNGGSSALASHFSNDLVKMGRIKSICVNDMTPTMMAYGNDEGWENMFQRPLSHYVDSKDAAFGISCSGNSENVINALRHAQYHDILTMSLTGSSLDSDINGCSDAILHTHGIHDIRVQEDLHSVVCHALARAIQEASYG